MFPIFTGPASRCLELGLLVLPPMCVVPGLPSWWAVGSWGSEETGVRSSLHLPRAAASPKRGRPTPKGTLAGRALAHTLGQIWLLPGHGVRKRQGQPFLNVLSWLSALRGVASGGWEKASGFGPWERRPLGSGFSQASLAISPTAVHARDGWSQGRGPAGPSRGPCRGSGLGSGLGTVLAK